VADIVVPLLGTEILPYLKSLEESDEGPYKMEPRCLFPFRIGTIDRFAEAHWDGVLVEFENRQVARKIMSRG